MTTLLMPLPDSDFDPTESGVPWCTMRDHGHHVVFATPSGRTARADPKMVTGEGSVQMPENEPGHIAMT
jgi:protease I